eukprot:6960816-Lingulodinium_polyedra.AAC.1
MVEPSLVARCIVSREIFRQPDRDIPAQLPLYFFGGAARDCFPMLARAWGVGLALVSPRSAVA